MRERTFKVDVAKLQMLCKLHRSKNIAETLGISKQRWHNYKVRHNDMPESVLDSLCLRFNLNKDDLIQE